MKTIIYSITSLLFGAAILLMGHGLAGSLITLRAAEEPFSDGLIGVIMSSYFVGYILGTKLSPKLITRIGHIRAFTIAASLCASLLLIQGLWANPWFWIATRFVYGACIVSFYLVIESWLNERAENEQRGKIFAIYMLVNLSAMAAGQQLLLFGDIRTLELFAIAATLLSLSLVPVALTRIPEPQKVAQTSVSLSKVSKSSPTAFIGCLASGIAGGAFWTMAPLFAHQVGLNIAATAAFMSATIIGGAALQLPIGKYSDGSDRRKVLIAVSFGAGVLALASMLAAELPMTILMVVMFGYGGLCFAIYPLCVALANDGANQEERIQLSGGLLLAYGVGAIIGPLASGLSMQLFGAMSLPVFYSVCWFGLAGIAWRQYKQKPKAPAESSTFAPLTRTSTEALHAAAVIDEPDASSDAPV